MKYKVHKWTRRDASRYPHLPASPIWVVLQGTDKGDFIIGLHGCWISAIEQAVEMSGRR